MSPPVYGRSNASLARLAAHHAVKYGDDEYVCSEIEAYADHSGYDGTAAQLAKQATIKNRHGNRVKLCRVEDGSLEDKMGSARNKAIKYARDNSDSDSDDDDDDDESDDSDDDEGTMLDDNLLMYMNSIQDSQGNLPFAHSPYFTTTMLAGMRGSRILKINYLHMQHLLSQFQYKENVTVGQRLNDIRQEYVDSVGFRDTFELSRNLYDLMQFISPEFFVAAARSDRPHKIDIFKKKFVQRLEDLVRKTTIRDPRGLLYGYGVHTMNLNNVNDTQKKRFKDDMANAWKAYSNFEKANENQKKIHQFFDNLKKAGLIDDDFELFGNVTPSQPDTYQMVHTDPESALYDIDQFEDPLRANMLKAHRQQNYNRFKAFISTVLYTPTIAPATKHAIKSVAKQVGLSLI